MASLSPPRETSALAIVSLVAGILGWTFAPVLGSLVAIVAGHLARADFRRDPARFDGHGFATAGLVLGYAATLLAIAALALLLLFSGGLLWFGTQH